MLRLTLLALGVCALLANPLPAADDDEEPKPDGRRRGSMTEEQKAVRKEMLEKYDRNKNGKIDEDERAAITPADKEKLARVGLGPITPRRRREPTDPVPRSPSPQPKTDRAVE
jgi:hypothetical protein